MKKIKPIIYREDFVFDDTKSEYVFKMKKRSFLWLWLLLLIVFIGLCFVRCERDITVKVVDNTTDEPVSPTVVTMDYTAHYLFNGGRFFDSESYSATLETDEDGDVVFEDLPCSVFSYIFYSFSRAHITVGNDCNQLKDSPASCLFHYTWKKILKLDPKTEEIYVMVTDRETGEPLAGASVLFNYTLGGKTITDSVNTNAAGKSKIVGVPRCGSVELETVSCYGYEDTTHIELSVLDVLSNPDSTFISLSPLKQSFTYFVKNKYTKQPIPEATVEVILTSGNGSVTRGQSTTNVDGQGRGAYNDAFILADLVLKATKAHYKPGQFEKKCTVKEFAELPDSSRVIYLEPEPYMEEFQNIDSISGQPIVGVENTIMVSGQNGETVNSTEISNRNGIFYVNAMEGDKVEIDSKCDPMYEPKHSVISSFEHGEKIPMKPRVTDLSFRTIVAGTQNLLPDCQLWIYDSNDVNYKPDNSGNGVFIVHNVPFDVNLSIVSTKDGYEDNEYSVRDKNVNYLSTANQSERDIPMTVMLPPCNGGTKGETNLEAGHVSAPVSYNMGVDQGSFEFIYDTGASQKDQIDIYNHKMGETYSAPPIWSSGMVATNGKCKVNISFHKGSVITIIVTTGDDGSVWDYIVKCPK